MKKGKGQSPQLGDKVAVHYIGKFIDGTPFDSSLDRGIPFSFTVGAGQVIPAWEEAILQLKVGGKILVITPSQLAYGEQGYNKKIPPFSPLIFEIKLLKINE